MGRFRVEFQIANHRDVILADNDAIDPGRVRRSIISGVVDTGATRLILPTSAAAALGLPESGETSVRFADGRTARRTVVSDAEIVIQGRSGTFSAVLEPNRTEALIGAIVLEELDFLVDCANQRLVPRDPNTTITEIE